MWDFLIVVGKIFGVCVFMIIVELCFNCEICDCFFVGGVCVYL